MLAKATLSTLSFYVVLITLMYVRFFMQYKQKNKLVCGCRFLKEKIKYYASI